MRPHDTEPDRPELHSRMVERSPVYYGWIVVLAGTLGAVMTTPGQTLGVSIFLDPIIADLGMSRSVVSTLYLFGTLVGSMFLPFAGRFIDRRGPRYAVIVFSAAFALACVWMGTVFEAVTLFLGFTLIRALGQGALRRAPEGGLSRRSGAWRRVGTSLAPAPYDGEAATRSPGEGGEP